MKSGNCSLSEEAIGSFNNISGDLMYGGYCQGSRHNSINIGLQTKRKNINTCTRSISIGVDSGSTMVGSSSEDSCGPDSALATGNISIGTRSGNYQYNPSIAIGYGVGSYDGFPQQPYSLSIQNEGLLSKISKHSLGLGTGNVPNLGETSIFIGTGEHPRDYNIHENAIVLSSSASGRAHNPYVSYKRMGESNEGFFVDTIRVNPINNPPSDSVPLVYSPSTGEIYATHSNPPRSPSCVQKYGQCGGSN